MDAIADYLPHLNACLNGASAVALVTGWIAIRGRRIAAHRAAMLSAFAFSALFLTSYLTKHFLAGSQAYAGPPALRPVYLAILVSHMLLAIPVVPLSITLIVLAFRGRIERHRRLARWTLPVWLYVSVTGVVVYWMLYQMTW